MHKWAHHVKVSVFVKPEDDEKEVRKALISLFPFDLSEEKIKVEESTAMGFSEKKIIILDVFLKKETHTQGFLRNLMSKLSVEQKALLRRTLDQRMDEEFNLMIDLDKNRLQSEQYWVVNAGPCFHTRIRAAAFPATRDAAITILEDMLSTHHELDGR